MKRIVIAVVVFVFAVVLPSAALAQSSACEAYNNCEPTTTTTTKLPFTGIDVGMVAASGITLLGAGFVVRRVAARRQY